MKLEFGVFWQKIRQIEVRYAPLARMSTNFDDFFLPFDKSLVGVRSFLQIHKENTNALIIDIQSYQAKPLFENDVSKSTVLVSFHLHDSMQIQAMLIEKVKSFIIQDHQSIITCLWHFDKMDTM